MAMYSGWATAESMTRLAYQRDDEQASEAVGHGWRARPLTVLVQLLALPREFTAVTATK
jgi:hypothetical protein